MNDKRYDIKMEKTLEVSQNDISRVKKGFTGKVQVNWKEGEPMEQAITYKRKQYFDEGKLKKEFITVTNKI